MSEIERKSVRFGRWSPVRRDVYVGYSYVVAAGPTGARRITPGTDRWHRAKYRIASSALAIGVTEFRVWGGLGSRSWVRTVIVSQADAEAYLTEAAERSFMLRSTLAKALAARDRRLEREGAQ